MKKHLLAFARLMRLPNVFTALADIGIGALAASNPDPLPAVWLLLCSACLYTAGMVWNDIFDIAEDARDRPFRPLPSGAVSRGAALGLGVSLVVVGLLAADQATASLPEHTVGLSPFLLAGGLVGAIFLYDARLKRTRFGPLGMGACRFLNVLLGWSLTAGRPGGLVLGVHLASVVGVYIVGVTWFARNEATTSQRGSLVGAATVMGLSLLLSVALPVHVADTLGAWPSWVFWILLTIQAGLVGNRLVRAVQSPSPSKVQIAIKTAILCLIVLDAALAVSCAGPAGLVLLLLLPPALLLGRWVYST